MSKDESPDAGYGKGVTKEQWREIRDWWLGQIVPEFREWNREKIWEGARYLQANSLPAASLINSKLQEGRLVIVGMVQHPSIDNLAHEIMESVDFIAFDVRSPTDKSGGLREDREGLAIIDVGKHRIEMPHAQAKKLYPDKYKDPDARNDAYDAAIEGAARKGIDVLFTMKGETWPEMNRLAAEEISEHMRRNPDSRGVYFSSIYSALKWPGYRNEKEREELDFGRPLSTDTIFSTNPRNDNSVRMAAYSLEQSFPGQVYSIGQFVMPGGYGMDWKNLRTATEESGIRERFAIDEIAKTPFAVQRYIFRGLIELSGIADEELWKYYGTIAQGFFGPAEVRWDRVLDGVIVYP